MIEKTFVAQKVKEYQIQQFISSKIGKGKYSYCEIRKTPLGEKIIIHTARPGLVVGKKGEVIRELSNALKNDFKMENPQVEVAEITKPEFDAQTMAEQIVSTIERFGPKRFKSVGYKTLQRILDAGALGAEIHIGGRGVPGARAKSWRFYGGYLKKCGDIAQSFVKRGFSVANIKSGSIGVKVQIMTPDTRLPDRIIVEGEKEAEEKKIMIEKVPLKEGEEKVEKPEEKIEEKVEKPEKKKEPKVEKPAKKKEPKTEKKKDGKAKKK